MTFFEAEEINVNDFWSFYVFFLKNKKNQKQSKTKPKKLEGLLNRFAYVTVNTNGNTVFTLRNEQKNVKQLLSERY